MTTLDNFKQKLEAFKNAFNELEEAWDELTPDENDIVHMFGDYPFKESFDEIDVNGWNESIQKIKSK